MRTLARAYLIACAAALLLTVEWALWDVGGWQSIAIVNGIVVAAAGAVVALGILGPDDQDFGPRWAR